MVSPATVEELAEVVRGAGPWRIEGMGTKRALCLDPAPAGGERGGGEGDARPDLPNGHGGREPSPTPLSTLALTGIVDWSPDDQVVVVRAGTPVAELQAELRAKGQCLPLPDPREVGLLPAGAPGTVGGFVAMGLPHALQGPCGGARDWVLGLTLVRADGAVARCGSRVVKNVAGYDVQKLMVGARGTLGVVAEVALRTYPVRALPMPDLVGHGEIVPERAWIQRTLRADYPLAAAAAEARSHRADPGSSTLWIALDDGGSPARFDEDWVLTPGAAPLPDGPMREWMRRTKSAFDPHGRLNPGAMGAW